MRNRDGDKDGNAVIDMGAYEYQPEHQISVAKSGSGDGKVTSSPARIDCGDTCSVLLKEDSRITLTAIADKDSVFAGWSGDCSGTGDCKLIADAAKFVTADFIPGLSSHLPIVNR